MDSTLKSEPQFWEPWLAWAEAGGVVCGMPSRDRDARAAFLGTPCRIPFRTPFRIPFRSPFRAL